MSTQVMPGFQTLRVTLYLYTAQVTFQRRLVARRSSTRLQVVLESLFDIRQLSPLSRLNSQIFMGGTSCGSVSKNRGYSNAFRVTPPTPERMGSPTLDKQSQRFVAEHSQHQLGFLPVRAPLEAWSNGIGRLPTLYQPPREGGKVVRYVSGTYLVGWARLFCILRLGTTHQATTGLVRGSPWRYPIAS